MTRQDSRPFRPAQDPIAASVIIVSRGRPAALTRCLTAVSQLHYPLFEVVVVADPVGLQAVERAGWSGRIKTAACDVANIAVARNIGISQAAGAVVAFIDDDAVPEPTWLNLLVAPFADPVVSAAGGFVLGRNGISLQWKARTATPDGQSHDMTADTDRVTLHTGSPRRAIRTEGTNMALRREMLAAMGGFDPAYRYYLDDTDLNMRLAKAGHVTAIVPQALVHHGFAASAHRRADRVPRGLHDIGVSLAAFIARHGAHLDHDACRNVERTNQRRRLLQHMVMGAVEPRDLPRLLAGFDTGWTAGAARPVAALSPLGAPLSSFRHLTPLKAGRHRIFAGRLWQRQHKAAKAAASVASGARATFYIFSRTARYHHVGFDPGGYWVQTGGLFGRSDRCDPLVHFWGLRERLRREVDRAGLCRLGHAQQGNKGADGRFVQEDSSGVHPALMTFNGVLRYAIMKRRPLSKAVKED